MNHQRTISINQIHAIWSKKIMNEVDFCNILKEVKDKYYIHSIVIQKCLKMVKQELQRYFLHFSIALMHISLYIDESNQYRCISFFAFKNLFIYIYNKRPQLSFLYSFLYFKNLCPYIFSLYLMKILEEFFNFLFIFFKGFHQQHSRYVLQLWNLNFVIF